MRGVTALTVRVTPPQVTASITEAVTITTVIEGITSIAAIGGITAIAATTGVPVTIEVIGMAIEVTLTMGRLQPAIEDHWWWPPWYRRLRYPHYLAGKSIFHEHGLVVGAGLYRSPPPPILAGLLPKSAL